jgi:putative transcriptional regulator
MTKPSLKARFARLGPVRAVNRVRSGSPVDLVLRPARKRIETVSAALALAQRGLSVLRAKRTIEAMIEEGEAVVHLPTVENIAALARELDTAGVKATRMARDPVDVQALRVHLGMTQEQFALRFGFDLDAVKNWEQGRRTPDRAVSSYMRVIARQPREAAQAQEEEVTG